MTNITPMNGNWMINSAKDFLGHPIEIGDEVVFYEPGYRNFLKGRIIKVTEQMVQIEYAGSYGQKKLRQFHDQVIVIRKPGVPSALREEETVDVGDVNGN